MLQVVKHTPSCIKLCCRSQTTNTFIADLAVRWPGVRHMLAIDVNQAAEYVVNLTSALALQPYKTQVTFCLSDLALVSRWWPAASACT